MDDYLRDCIRKDTPVMNPDVVNGLATTHLPFAEQMVDSIWKVVSQDFIPGLKYEGYKVCTPIEEFDIVTQVKNSKRIFDISRSDLFLVKYFFSYTLNGVKKCFDTKFYLPYVTDGGYLFLGGSRFQISPVLADRVISYGTSNIFVRLMRDRLIFDRINHIITIDNKKETIPVVWSMIYHKSPSAKVMKATVKAKCTLVHYLLCKHGFTGMFKNYLGFVPIVTDEAIDVGKYPTNDWVVCESTGMKPKGNLEYPYFGSNIRLIIPREKFNSTTKALVAGFFYILDYFPSRISIRDYKNNNKLTVEFLDSTVNWMILLGHIIFTGNYGDGKLANDIKEHFNSLDEYIDGLVSQKLKDINYPCRDTYELFFTIIQNFNEWLIKGKDTISSMYDKELSILYYVLNGIISSIFKLHFRLKKESSKKILSEKNVLDLFTFSLKRGTIFGIANQHNGVTTVSYSGDNKIFKVTSGLVPQKASSKQGTANKRPTVGDPSKHLHSSIAEVGGYLNLPKSDPSGKAQLNPYVKLINSSVIERNEEFIDLLDSVQSIIKRD